MLIEQMIAEIDSKMEELRSAREALVKVLEQQKPDAMDAQRRRGRPPGTKTPTKSDGEQSTTSPEEQIPVLTLPDVVRPVATIPPSIMLSPMLREMREKALQSSGHDHH